MNDCLRECGVDRLRKDRFRRDRDPDVLKATSPLTIEERKPLQGGGTRLCAGHPPATIGWRGRRRLLWDRLYQRDE